MLHGWNTILKSLQVCNNIIGCNAAWVEYNTQVSTGLILLFDIIIILHIMNTILKCLQVCNNIIGYNVAWVEYNTQVSSGLILLFDIIIILHIMTSLLLEWMIWRLLFCIILKICIHCLEANEKRIYKGIFEIQSLETLQVQERMIST